MALLNEPTSAQELKTMFNPETCVRKGLCPVTDIRNKDDPLESHSLYFEQHGTGSEKVVFIMGLNSSSFAWLPQVDDFGKSPQYSVLVFDNRGVGNSGVPRGPYTTSGMAQDVIALLDFVGWTEKRQIHVVGISLGGMVSQELAARIPERIASLTLTVTTAGSRPWPNFPPWKGFISLARLMVIQEPELKVPIILDMVYPSTWLDAKSDRDPNRTNRQVQTELYLRRIATTKPQTFIGAVSQMYAGLTHYVSPTRLRDISLSIPKVLIITGDDDHLVRPSNSRYLKKHMPQAELLEWEGTGHGINGQRTERYNRLLERVWAEGRSAA